MQAIGKMWILSVLGEYGYTHAVGCALLWAFGLKVLVFTGLSSAQCGVFIIADIFLPVFGFFLGVGGWGWGEFSREWV